MTTSIEFQYDWPVFVRSRHYPIIVNGKVFEYQDHVPWKEMGVSEDIVKTWFISSLAYHNTDLEVQTKVGDRLSEMNGQQLETLVDRMNVIIRSRTNSTNEFQAKRCKKSKIDDKQRGLIRSFLRANRWIEEDFFSIRKDILGE